MFPVVSVYAMVQTHEPMFRRITRRFGSYPIMTYSYRVLSYLNVHINCEELSERALNLYKTCT